VDLINAMEFCERTSYLETNHTARHFRSLLWNPAYFDRTYRRDGPMTPWEGDEKLLKKADTTWRELVAQHKDPEFPESWAAELDSIVEAAKTELLRQATDPRAEG